MNKEISGIHRWNGGIPSFNIIEIKKFKLKNLLLYKKKILVINEKISIKDAIT